MAFKTVTDLNTDNTISLGGFNKKQKKDNPTTVEGYYLGKRTVADDKKKSGVSYIYILQTPKGNLGVWGKTDMDRKMVTAPEGAMLRITHTGMQATSNGDMYKYKVEIDVDNCIEVAALPTGKANAALDEGENDEESTEEDSEDSYQNDERAQQGALQAAERAAKVKALLNGSKRK